MKKRALRRLTAFVIALAFIANPSTLVYGIAPESNTYLTKEELLSNPEMHITIGQFAMLINQALNFQPAAK
ncbi:MAG: hypothetical protein LBV08_10255, partial [Clostridiales bacterium]|nr:hypothetical protein [Clostridiales bacterium]